jgi:hypothetical protein
MLLWLYSGSYRLLHEHHTHNISHRYDEYSVYRQEERNTALELLIFQITHGFHGVYLRRQLEEWDPPERAGFLPIFVAKLRSVAQRNYVGAISNMVY